MNDPLRISENEMGLPTGSIDRGDFIRNRETGNSWLVEDVGELTVRGKMLTLRSNPSKPSYPQFDVRLPVVCFDFDGVLASAKWPKPEIGEPDPAAKEAVEHYASKGCEVIVCSARPASHHPRIWKWLEDQGLSWAIYDVTNVKPVASLYFDDRAVRWPL